MPTFFTLDLADSVYLLAKSNTETKGPLRDQLLRAASSVSLNLSEGNARHSVGDRKNFFVRAHASAKEVKTILKITDVRDPELLRLADFLCACSYKLLQNVKANQYPEATKPES